MLKRGLLAAICLLATLLASFPVFAQTNDEVKRTESIKREVAGLGAGTRVAVKLRDKKKVVGHINYAGDDFFVLTEEKTQASQKLSYSNVEEIKLKKEGGFPKKGKIALGILGVLMVMGLATNGGG